MITALLVSGLFYLLSCAFLSGVETLRFQQRVSRGASYHRFPQWIYIAQFGTRKGPFALGAGYIGGSTFYIARNCVTHGAMYTPKPWRIGFTLNANAVPWTQH